MPPQDDDVRESQQSVDNLLNEIPTGRNHWRIYRLATLPWNDQFLAELELDALGEQEMQQLLLAAGYRPTSLEELCDRIGAEAVRLELDGLVVPSARQESGSNLPVFKRPAIRAPKSQDVVKITLDPRTGEVATASVPAENT